ncbi:MAG: hypothetical protein WCX22_05100 [Methanoregula sp.]
MRQERMRGQVLCLIVLLVLTAMIVSGGCVKTLQQSLESTPATGITPESTAEPDEVAYPDTSAVPVKQLTVAEMTPKQSAAVTEANPIVTIDPYPILHGTRINSTELVNPVWCDTCGYEFQKNYKMRGNAAGLIVNVVEGPLYIIYTVTPQNDCLENPDSCRGDLEKPVNRPYLTITVRDNQTQEVVAEDGYGREYSSDTGSYEFEITTKTDDGTEITDIRTPGPRVIKIFREGTYHLTIQGNFLDANIMIRTGASPSGAGTSIGSTSDPGAGEEEW